LIETRETSQGKPVNFSGLENIVLIVLGKNWKSIEPLELSDDSKMSVLALGYCLRKVPDHVSITAIFTTGQTAGAQNISEAKAMFKFLKESFPEFEDAEAYRGINFILEEESLDTIGNAEKIRANIDASVFAAADQIFLITLSYHMKRSVSIFKKTFGFNFYSINSDEIINDPRLEVSDEDESFIFKRINSFNFSVIEPIKEFILRLIRKVDKNGKFIGWLSRKIRFDFK
jgi:hypothetical protein